MAQPGQVTSEQLRQRIDPRVDSMQMEMLELFAALVNLGMPPQAAQQAAERLVESGIRRPAKEPANQEPGTPAEQDMWRRMSVYEQKRLKEEAQQRLQRDEERYIARYFPGIDRNGRSAAAMWQGEGGGARNIPPYVPDPNLMRKINAVPPNAPIRLAPGPGFNPALAEVKEREEKYGDENARIAQAQQQQRQAPGPWGDDLAPPRQAALDESQLMAYKLANDVPYYSNPRNYLTDARTNAALGVRPFTELADNYMNPYIGNVVNKIREEGMRTFNEGILPALEAKFVRAGTHGGSRHATLAERAARDLQSEIMKQQGQALHAGYGQGAQIFNADQTRRLQGAESQKNLGLAGQASNLANIGMLTEAGRMKQAHEQQRKDIAWQDQMRRKEEPFLRLAQQAAIMKGLNFPTTSEAYSYRPPEQQLNNWGNFGSISAQLLGGLLQRPRQARTGGHITLNLGRR